MNEPGSIPLDEDARLATNAIPAARSTLYALFAEAFTHPEGAQLLRLLDGDLLGDITAHIDTLPMAVDIAPATEYPHGLDALRDTQQTYTDLFESTGSSPAVSLLERRYGEVPEQQLWEDLLRYYKHFGLDFSTGQAAEQPDHLLTELSFMHYLCFLEAGAKGGQESFQRGQRDFLFNHLGKWTGRFAAKLTDAGYAGPYAQIGGLLDAMIRADMKLLDSSLDDY